MIDLGLYLIEVMDDKGNRKIYQDIEKDIEKEMPYVVVKLVR